MRNMRKLIFGVCVLPLLYMSNSFADSDKNKTIETQFNYLKLNVKKPPALSNVIESPKDSGYQGAQLGIADSNSTGKFLKQHFSLNYDEFEQSTELLERLTSDYLAGQRVFILDVPAEVLIQANTWAKEKEALIFNVSESADGLRYKQCLSSVLHTIPSDAMRSDAIAQWLLSRRLDKVLLVSGSKDEDIALSDSFKRSAKRFGLDIVEEKTWTFNSDLRRTAQLEVPLFTQTRNDYDVVYVADKSKDFAEYIPFNTYIPRPVVGSAGLEALTWHAVIEQWGAAQLQKRFRLQADRQMNELDFSAYLAVRSVAQAVHQQKTNDHMEIQTFIKSDDFELAAYKGRKLSFRSWSGQLRIPMALIQPNSLVSLSPQVGVLHPRTELDTLGFDIEESQCITQKEQL